MLALRYADTDEPVFSSVDEVLAQPFRLQQRLMRLAAECVTVNGMEGETDESPPP
jgi:hypothetical protein